MNLYFLVEGERTEVELYPKWLSYLLPELTQVFNFSDVVERNFYLFSGAGFPSIFNHLMNAIADINHFGNYDYLIVCLDSDDLSISETKQLVYEKMEESGANLRSDCQLEVIVQHPTIETWLLGNRRVYKRNPQGEKFRKYAAFYNVSKDDPELMEKMPDFRGTKAIFHERYLREMLKEQNVNYRKSSPREVLVKTYFEQLQKRVAAIPTHLQSLQAFLNLCAEIREKL